METFVQKPGSGGGVRCPGWSPWRGTGWVPLASVVVPGTSPWLAGPCPLRLGHPPSICPWVPAQALATPAPRGRTARSKGRWRKALPPAQEDEEKATFVSCSHLALAARGGGARGGRCGSAPPTGNFRKMLMGAGRIADVAEVGGPGPQTHHQKRRGRPSGRGRRAPQHVAGQQPARGHWEHPAQLGPGTRQPCGQVVWPGHHVVSVPRARASRWPGSSQLEAMWFPRLALRRTCSSGDPGWLLQVGAGGPDLQQVRAPALGTT